MNTSSIYFTLLKGFTLPPFLCFVHQEGVNMRHIRVVKWMGKVFIKHHHIVLLINIHPFYFTLHMGSTFKPSKNKTRCVHETLL